VVPILGIIFNGYMMYKLGWVNWARLIIWLAIGLVIYFTYSRITAVCAARLSSKSSRLSASAYHATPLGSKHILKVK